MQNDLRAENSLQRLTLKTEEIMELTGWGRDKTQALIKAGMLPNIGGRRILVPRKALEQYLEAASNPKGN